MAARDCSSTTTLRYPASFSKNLCFTQNPSITASAAKYPL